MKKEEVTNPPCIELLLIFVTYGGLLLVALTSLFWKWSAMASLGSFYLILGAPIIMGIIAYRNYGKRELSKYYLWTFWSGLLYFVIAPVTMLVTVMFE
jgi:hypothetical protein